MLHLHFFKFASIKPQIAQTLVTFKILGGGGGGMPPESPEISSFFFSVAILGSALTGFYARLEDVLSTGDGVAG